MLRNILTFSASIIFSQSIENISYDFINHQGHILNKGSLVWNEDWHSNGLFFDGTFANYPSMYGPVIEDRVLKPIEDISNLDSSKTLSYFDYVQGDYYLDNLDLGIKYSNPGRVINLHAFKRRYAGAYSHYNYGAGRISPIHYTFLGNYNFRRNNEKLFMSMGNFNSDYGLLDSSNTSFLDSKITSSSLKYENQYDSLLFKLDYNKIEKLEGWGRLSVENLQYSINQKKNISLERLIYSLGIRHIGLENAKLLSKHFISFSKFKSLSIQSDYEDLLNIDGIGETQVNSIKSFFSNKSNIRVLNELEKVLIIKNAVQNSDNGLLKNKTFLVTGKLNGISRAEVKSLIEENSGKTISSVSKKLNFLIIGEKPTKKKVDYAKQLKIKVIDQAEFLKMLNKSS